jgi:hypothetical protein
MMIKVPSKRGNCRHPKFDPRARFWIPDDEKKCPERTLEQHNSKGESQPGQLCRAAQYSTARHTYSTARYSHSSAKSGFSKLYRAAEMCTVRQSQVYRAAQLCTARQSHASCQNAQQLKISTISAVILTDGCVHGVKPMSRLSLHPNGGKHYVHIKINNGYKSRA